MARGKQIAPLSEARVRSIKPTSKETVHAVGHVPGLYLRVKPSGSKSWVLRVYVDGKRREMGLGGYPEISLAKARERGAQARDDLWHGQDPIGQRRASLRAQAAADARSITFADAMERFLEVKLAEFDNPKHRKQWRATLDAYAAPVLGKMQVADISVQDVLRVLSPIWTTKNETASRLRGRIEAILNWATTHGFRTGPNPAQWKGNLDTTLPKPSKVAKVQHHPALPVDIVPDWMADLRGRDGTATRALEFMALTTARSGEVRGMVWSEVDLEAGIWTIPADRMKAGKEHRVPLSAAAIEVLLQNPMPMLAPVGPDEELADPYVFPAQRGGQLSDAALSACMKRIAAAKPDTYVDARSGRPAVPHGLRSTFRDWGAECGVDRDMLEIQLAHTVGSEVERAYRRTDMVERRRKLMDDWARFLSGETGQVIDLAANTKSR